MHPSIRSEPGEWILEDDDFTYEAQHENDFQSFIAHSKTDDYSDLFDLLRPSKAELDKLGHQAEDFIIHCSFDKTNCSNL